MFRKFISVSCTKLPAVFLIATVLPSCVKRSDYEELAHRLDSQKRETDEAKAATAKESKKVEEVTNKLEQSEAETQKAIQDLESLKKKFEALKVEYDGFKGQRRAAMVGKKYPEVLLANGKKLVDAVIKEFNLTMVTFAHQGGIAKVALRELNDDIRWEACWNEHDASESDAMVEAENQRLDEQRLAAMKEDTAKSKVDRIESLKKKLLANQTALTQLNIGVEKLRHDMNTIYVNLFRNSTSTVRTVAGDWNTAAPEASPMLTDFKKRPVVLGISELETKRDEVLVGLRRISATEKEINSTRAALNAALMMK